MTGKNWIGSWIGLALGYLGLFAPFVVLARMDFSWQGAAMTELAFVLVTASVFAYHSAGRRQRFFSTLSLLAWVGIFAVSFL